MTQNIDISSYSIISDAIRSEARRILADGTVAAVIGYTPGRRKGSTQPIVITAADQSDQLIFTAACLNDLVVYLTKAKKDVPKTGRVGIVVKGCDLKALVGLLGESQLQRENLYLIGIPCSGVLGSLFKPAAALTAETIASKCCECTDRLPQGCDFVPAAEPASLPELEPRYAKEIARLEAMSPAERWEYWKEQFSKCIKCYACRQVCPFCFCEQCLCDRNRPQMVEQTPRPSGNTAWHLVRAMHLAGRCAGCGECERVCPMDIPLNLLNRKMARELKELFNSEAGFEVRETGPLTSYREDDDQSFIR
ncbi:MAG: 4Fe-4S dicluster domain-containing protein [Geobacter sp.]|nr:4Fe-4S dicluster domain-containing protein [Geobacter sp.]